MSLTLYSNEAIGIELHVNNETGAVFTSIRGAARICQVNPSTIQRFIENLSGVSSVAPLVLEEAEIITPAGLRSVAQVDEALLLKCITKYRPDLLAKCAEAGLRVYLHGLVGIEYKGQLRQSTPALPPSDVRLSNFMTALNYFGIDMDDPRLGQSVKDIMGDIMLASRPAIQSKEPEWLGVVEKAERLGYPVSLVAKHRSTLGRWVKARSQSLNVKQEKRLCNGTMRDIYLYQDSPALDEIVHSYMSSK